MKKAKWIILISAAIIGAFDVGRSYERLSIAKTFLNQTESD